MRFCSCYIADMFTLYLVTGLINILAQNDNYGIKNTDIRERRDITAFKNENVYTNLYTNHIYDLIRERRQIPFYIEKNNYINNGITNMNYNNNANGRTNYTWNLIQNERNINNHKNNSYKSYNETPGYPPQHTSVPTLNPTGRRSGKQYSDSFYNISGYDNLPTIYPYSSPKPVYNYQDPYKNNFNGYLQQNASRPYNGTASNTTVNPYGSQTTQYDYIKPQNSSSYYYNYNNTPVPFEFRNGTTNIQYGTARPGYGNTTAGYRFNSTLTTTTIYNYQDPYKSNFDGYLQQNISRPYNGTDGTVNPYGSQTTQYNYTQPQNGSVYYYNYNNTPTPFGFRNGSTNAGYGTQNSSTYYYNYNSTPVPFGNGTTNAGYGTARPGYESTTSGYGYNSTLTTTTPKIIKTCILCDISCPYKYHWEGFFCVPDKNNKDDDY